MANFVKKQRVKYIDALRGFTMLLVVLQHVTTYSFGIQPYDTALTNILVSFRMPMFFFISGYIAYKSTAIWDKYLYKYSLKKKAIVQLIPTAFFFSLYCFSNYDNPIITFLSIGLGGYWFTFVLFEMFCIFYSISFLSKKYFSFILIFLSFIGIVSLVMFRSDSQLWTMLCLENLCKYFQFFALGLLCRKYNNHFLALMKNDLFKTVILIIFIVSIIIVTRTSWGIDSFIGKNAVRSIFIRYSGLFVVFSFFLSKETFFSKENVFNKCIQFIGRRTLDIYLIHYFLIPQISNISFNIKGSAILEFCVPAIFTIVIVGMCLLISEVIRNSHFLGHYLFGVKSEQ